MREPGLEPGTSSLSATRSNQLSYTRNFGPVVFRQAKFGAEIVTQGSALSTLILTPGETFSVSEARWYRTTLRLTLVNSHNSHG